IISKKKMAKPSTFRLLNGVKPARSNWLIRVKVLHSWKQNTSFGGETFECVLADETVIGEWKTIDTFQVLAASGHYRPTNHQYKLILSGETIVTKCDLLSDKIYLSLSSYDDLRNIDEKKNFFLKDVIGQVVDLNGVQKVQAMGKDKKMVQFRLHDCSGDEIACCLWGKFAEKVETILEDCNNERVIMLIRFAKISFFRGEVQVTNAFDASIVDINPIYEEAIEFKKSCWPLIFLLLLLREKKQSKSLRKKKEDWNEIEVRSISEILVAAEVESCKIICSIESVDTDWGWYYIGCNRHNRRVTKLAGNGVGKPIFYCDICRANTSNVSPKYKLHLFVKDDSEACQVMMLNSVAQSIIGTTATELWDGPYDEYFILGNKTPVLEAKLLNGVKIAASCKRNQIFRLQRELPVGEWKTIDTFQVLAASGHYRPTNHQYKLILSGETIVTKCDLLSDKIYLSLSSYDDLRNIDEKKNFFLKDVIGQVVDLNGVQKVQAMGKDKKMVQFRLHDCSGDEIACCLWGKFAEKVETILEDCNNERVIMLIRFAKISFFRGEVQVTNAFDASIVDINPIYEEAIEFKKSKLLATDLPLAVIERKEAKQIAQKKKEDWNEIEVRSISEILVAAEVESCKIICSIESVDTDWGWYYIGCNRHNRRVTKLAGNGVGKPIFYCDICRANTSNVSPKYKLHLFVKDDSEACQVMMLDSVAQSIIGTTATELWDGSYDEVWSGDKIQKIESQTEPSSCFDTNSTLSGGDVFLVDQNKESSSEGFSTPLLKRKEEDADLLDMTSTSKMKCTKMIKLEKTKTDE
ncbi:hypothetical protein HID58_047541, partial [Brassica napus]